MNVLIAILEKLACKHKWKMEIETKGYDKDRSDLPFEILRTYVCSECGKFKKIKV